MSAEQLLDDRARSAARALRERSEQRVTVRANPRRFPRQGMRLWLAFGCVVLVIAGLVALGHRRTPMSESEQDLRFVIDGLPVGWSAEQAAENAPSARTRDAGGYALYGTAGDPTAPVASVWWMSSAEFSDEDAYSWLMMTRAMEEIEDSERTASCGRRLLVSETAEGPEPAWRCIIPADGGWVVLSAAGVDRDQVIAMINGFTLADGVVALSPTLWPSGAAHLAPVGSLADASDSEAVDTTEMRPSGTDGVMVAVGKVVSTSVSYVSGADHIRLSVGRVADGDIAAAGLGVAWQRAEVGGGLVVYRIVEGQAVMWQRDGLSFTLTGGGAGIDLAALAATVRPATDAEWAALTALPTPAPPSDEVVATTSDAVETVPTPSIDVVRDVEVEEHYADVTPDAVEFTALPQAIGTLSVGVVDGAAYLATDFMGEKVSLDDGSLKTARVGSLQVGDLVAVYAITANSAVTQMRVTCSDGTRYLVNFVAVSQHKDVRVAVAFLPASLPQLVDVVDVAGMVLADRTMG